MLVSRSLLPTNAGKRLKSSGTRPLSQPIYQGEGGGNIFVVAAPQPRARLVEKKYFNMKSLRSEYPNQVTMTANGGHIRCG
jgi:hypothetical protein